MTSAVEMSGIVKRFGDVLALSGVDFDVRPGEIHALLGENGAGKSTLMHILRGLTRADAGSIRRNGSHVAIRSGRDATRYGIEMVHQHFALVENLTVEENLRLSLAQPGVRERPDRLAAKAIAMAERLGWNFVPSARIWQLPVGVRQRLEIVKALAADPAVLIFDEPTAVLTTEECDGLFTVLRTLRAEGRAIVFISHRLEEIMSLCDRVTVLRKSTHQGTLDVSDTSPAELAVRMLGESPVSYPPCRENAPLGAVAVEAVGISARDDRGLMAIRDVSISSRHGEILGIAGVDGNGQTELAEALVGLRKRERGSVLIGGRPPRIGADRLAYVPQDRRRTGLVAGLSVRDNLAISLTQSPRFRSGIWVRTRAVDSEADALVEKYGIRVHSLEQRVETLSGGNQQKVVLARVFSGAAPAVVAVNPTRGLDIGAAAFVRQQLLAAKARGCSVVLLSTDLDEIRELADRLAVMHRGRLTDCASPTISRRDLGLLMGGKSLATPVQSDAGPD